MSCAYTWNPKTKELTVHQLQLTMGEAAARKLKGHEVVDQHYDHANERFGRFIDGKDGWYLGWESIPWNSLDPEFRAHLLLLGVV